MKRDGHIFETACDIETIKLAMRKASLGKRHHRNVARVLADPDRHAAEIRTMLLDATFVPSTPKMKSVYDTTSGKTRAISRPPFYPDQVVHWAQKKVREVEKERLSGFILKSRSPSCGLEVMSAFHQGCPAGKKFVGLFARTLMGHLPLLPVEDAERLHDPEARKTFLDRVLSVGRRRGRT